MGGILSRRISFLVLTTVFRPRAKGKFDYIIFPFFGKTTFFQHFEKKKRFLMLSQKYDFFIVA